MSAATRDCLRIEKAAGSCGAYVTGIDLSKPLDGEEIAGLRGALLDHFVVALPDQNISLDDLERLTDQLGGRDVTPFVTPMPDRPYVIRILKEPHEKLNFANAWHASALRLYRNWLSGLSAHHERPLEKMPAAAM